MFPSISGKFCLFKPGVPPFRPDALPTKLQGQLRNQCPLCPSVLLVSDGLSLTHQVGTPSDTQHATFVLFWASECFIC